MKHTWRQCGILVDNMMKHTYQAARIGLHRYTIVATISLLALLRLGVSAYDFKRAVEDGATVPLTMRTVEKRLLDLHNPEITDQILMLLKC